MLSTDLPSVPAFRTPGLPLAWIPHPTVTVILPTLNEAENLPYVIPHIPSWVDEILLVDGYSTDDTVVIARQLRPDIQVVMQQGRGKGAALRTGFIVARGDIIITLDADGSTDPAEIPAFVGVLMAGADFAKGTRFLQGGGTADMPFHRKFGNWALLMLVKILFGGKYSDLCYGYNAFWKHSLPLLNLNGDGFEIETLINISALCAGLRIVEVPSFEAKRIHGEGRLRAIPDGWRVLKAIMKEWIQHPRLRATECHHWTVANDVFFQTVKLLCIEALSLLQNRHRLSPQAYQTASAAVKDAYLILLNTETDSPRSKLRQQHHDYSARMLWSFLALLTD